MIERLMEMIKRHEGYRARPYDDEDGKEFGKNGKTIVIGNISIGWGRNLQSKGISKEEAELLLSNDIQTAVDDARKLILDYDNLPEDKKLAFANMAYQLGRTRMLGFYNMLLAVAEKDWKKVRKEMLDSLWGRRFKQRALELANLVYPENEPEK